MSSSYLPICLWCKYFNIQSFENDKFATCNAFPNGIPNLVFHGDFDHREPFPNDNNIQFKTRDNGDDVPKVIKFILEDNPNVTSNELLISTLNLLENNNNEEIESKNSNTAEKGED